MTLIVVLIAAISLFSLAYLTKRRFGVLGLALCAGALLSETLSIPLSNLIDAYQWEVMDLPDTALAALVLILLPSLLLLFGGPKYDTKKQAVIGSLGYVLLALLLSIEPLVGSLVLDEASRNIVRLLIVYESLLIAMAVAIAVMDMVMVHRPHIGRPKKH